ncbi:hypothetical protein, partial [Desulfosoma sp.]|uniref:hypothetical protein n=1 Tax=Desulfosoma sp. TaxID=2603217 RepID=UPI00404A022D
PAITIVDNNTIWPHPPAGTTTLGYKGAPVIPTVIDFTLGSVLTSLRYGAWDDGEVTLTHNPKAPNPQTIYPAPINEMVNYHYSNIPAQYSP